MTSCPLVWITRTLPAIWQLMDTTFFTCLSSSYWDTTDYNSPSNWMLILSWQSASSHLTHLRCVSKATINSELGGLSEVTGLGNRATSTRFLKLHRWKVENVGERLVRNPTVSTNNSKSQSLLHAFCVFQLFSTWIPQRELSLNVSTVYNIFCYLPSLGDLRVIHSSSQWYRWGALVEKGKLRYEVSQ